MKILRLFLTVLGGLVLAIGLTLVLFLFSLNLPGSATSALAGGTVRYVATTGSDAGNDCLDSNNPCATVQHAVDAANEEDEIRVAEGTYTGVSGRPAPLYYNGPSVITQVLFISKTVSVLGGYTTTNWNNPDPTSNLTILDAQDQGRVIVVGTIISPVVGSVSPRISGFQITGGDAAGLGGVNSDQGGGILVFVLTGTITLENNVVISNTAISGGGAFFGYGEGLLVDNVFQENFATNDGGGIFAYSDIVLNNNTIISNTSHLDGGGIHLKYNQASLTNNTIRANTSWDDGGGVYLIDSNGSFVANLITDNYAWDYGGGLAIDEDTNIIMTGNKIRANQGDDGGGMAIADVFSAFISDNIFMENSADMGGGLLLLKTGFSGPSEFINNVVTDNYAESLGSGILTQGAKSHFLHTTIARNIGGERSGIHISSYYDYPDWLPSQIWMTNTIIVSQTIGVYTILSNTATLNSVLWFDNLANSGGIGIFNSINEYTGDPAFSADGYHLTSDSSALDNGIPTNVTTDIDGETRPYGPAPDLGADEFSIPIPPTSVTLTGPTAGLVNTPYTFTATVTPITTTTPITYVWETTEQIPITHSSGITDQVTFNWNTPGNKVITVTATNITGTVSSVYSITIDAVPPITVEVTGPNIGVPSITYTFTGTVSPFTTTLPITYIWQTDDPLPVTHTAGISDTITFIWSTPGTKTITLTVDNGYGTVSTPYTVTIEHKIYLPIIVR